GVVASPAHATISADAQPVVDRYLHATGGAAALSAERSTHARFTLSAFGLAGKVESWSRLPDCGASVTAIGPFTLREGDDGQVAWRIDQNGRYAVLGGTDLEQTRAATWYENEMWARPGQGGGDVRRVGPDQDSLGTYIVLEATAPNGHPRRLWFDDRTGLLVRSVQRDDMRDITDVLADYRKIAGRLRPARTVIRVANMPLNDATMTLDTLWVNETLADTLFTSRQGAPDTPHFHGGEPHATIPFEYGARHVWLKVSVNGGPFADFLLDTGASITVLDSAFAAVHGIQAQGRVQVSGAGSDQGGASFAEIRSLFVPGPDGEGVELGAEKIAVLSLAPHLEPFFWRPVAGVLGYDFISRFAMTLDYDAATVTFTDPASFQPPAGATEMPFELASNIPVIEARLDSNLTGRFRLDVGSGSTVDLHGPFVRAHDLENHTGPKLTALGGGFGGTFSGDITRMKRMDIGPFGWDDPIVILSGATQGGLASEDYAGNIGNQVLERFQVTFDYTRKTLWLKPGSRYAKRDEFSLAGLQLARFDGAVRAMNVLAGSPAERAGLKEGDEVLAVDGRAMRDWTLESLDAMFEHGVPGSRHKIEYRRDGRKKNAKLTLERMI
ncbi:MAG TPA: PDZ domain-containing protein, partial [Dongiaceae bacterium]|nr:PDZ domain-containing protein [Dongiaceae bacterium]